VSDPSVELQLCLAMEQQANAALRARLAEAERQLYALVGNTQDLAKAKHDAAVFLGLPSIYGLTDSASRCTWCGPDRINTDPCPVCGSTPTVSEVTK
jgi:formate dehydrogenase maturation protein FdhE